MPGWEQGELGDWPRAAYGGLVWVPLGRRGAWVERPTDADLEAFEQWLTEDDDRARDGDEFEDFGPHEQAAEARRRGDPLTIRKPWEVNPVEATTQRMFGWCGDNTWAVTRWANQKYL